MSPHSSSLAFFHVRAWTEDARFRARITSSQGADRDEAAHLTVDPEEVVRWLREWLDEVAR